MRRDQIACSRAGMDNGGNGWEMLRQAKGEDFWETIYFMRLLQRVSKFLRGQWRNWEMLRQDKEDFWYSFSILHLSNRSQKEFVNKHDIMRITDFIYSV